MPRSSIWTRLVALFLLWSGLRSVWFLILGDTNPGFRLARDLGFRPALQFGEILHAAPVLCLTPLLILWWRREEFPE